MRLRRVVDHDLHRIDSSMDLIDQITSTALNPEYARAHESTLHESTPQEPPQRQSPGENSPNGSGSVGSTLRTRASSPWRVVTVGICLVLGVVLAGAGLSATQAADEGASEREALIDSINAAQERNAQQIASLATVRNEVSTLQSQALADQPAVLDRLNALHVAVGDTDIVGPGIVITLSDGPADDEEAQVVDQDLRIITNGLWQAGAEAVSINGHRITARTAIHDAGQAITVDYRSVSSPYTVEAIGEGQQLTGKFADTAASSWLAFLQSNHQIRYGINVANSDVQLAGDPQALSPLVRRKQ